MKKFLIISLMFAMLSLGACAGLGPIVVVEAVDDMVVDIIPGDAAPQFNMPFLGDLHTHEWSWADFNIVLPWTWFSVGPALADSSED